MWSVCVGVCACVRVCMCVRCVCGCVCVINCMPIFCNMRDILYNTSTVQV